jgi:3-oxoacyl-[acyl-carrier protein] reductase
MSVQFDFGGKSVLVTGSTLGIGRAVASAFHHLGAAVAINGRSKESVDKTIQELGGGDRLIAAPGDLSSKSEIDHVLAGALHALGGLDVLINNAGRRDVCAVDNISEQYWRDMLALNLKSAFFTSQGCVPPLRKSKGCIINVSSALGMMGGPAGSIVYTTAKHAISHLTRMMALQFAGEGIRINAIAPGWIGRPMAQRESEQSHDDALLDLAMATTPLGRMGTAEECAAAMLYLASPLAAFTTGTTMAVDGGFSSGRLL